MERIAIGKTCFVVHSSEAALRWPCSLRKIPSGVDLTFATHLAANAQGECQIRNSTENMDLLVVPLILTFAKVAAEKGCEC
jgi:hypothetical protein